MIDVRARLVAVALPEEEEFTPSALAHLLGINYHVVFRAVRTGDLPYPDVRAHGRYTWRREALRQAQLKAVGE